MILVFLENLLMHAIQSSVAAPDATALPAAYGTVGALILVSFAAAQAPLWATVSGSLLGTFGAVAVAYYRYRTNSTIDQLTQQNSELKRLLNEANRYPAKYETKSENQ